MWKQKYIKGILMKEGRCVNGTRFGQRMGLRVGENIRCKNDRKQRSDQKGNAIMLIPTRSLRSSRSPQRKHSRAWEETRACFVFRRWSQAHQRLAIPPGLSTTPPNIPKAPKLNNKVRRVAPTQPKNAFNHGKTVNIFY